MTGWKFMTKTVLVTGVSSGIGRAQAQLFLENGWRVYGVDQSKKPNLTGDFHFLQQDLTLALQSVFNWCPQVDVLCNTAGVLDDYKPLLEQSAQEIQEIFEINYVTPVELTRYYLTQMLKKQSGIIINMCSIASSLAGGGGHAYTSSKHALAGFTKQLALDYAEQGVQVFGIAPGAVKTGMTAADFEPGGLADWVAEETPIKRWLDPQEVADVTLFLASGKAAAMQGEILKIDGGWSLK
ncbi:oxidoreductase, short chain dehydrogenase/reductase family protein [Streptococcus sp. OBRC6]|nr:oxidoreductase, short chain dehydrogenase/reductase family protein [Streptococcus sp. OBRC6]EUB19025.1 oxidoreductase, short chain dehydrogenase/reductase family protein [Streptococcus sp. ACC21]EUC77125.1 oxidoreductase, short chain dehydrogenase/reductase family protein [Streptococcus sp. CM7]EWC99052.1 oxidoreductase, short chain dehydrogenase/reductase family protein [Streptococcus sp. AC15]